MAEGIGSESTGMTSISNDVDFYRYKYRDYEQQLDGSRIHVSFVSPIFSVFEKYRFYLLQNSVRMPLERKHWYRPDYISFLMYGTTAWWQLVLWLNNVSAIEYFTIDEVIVPTPEAVDILQQEAYTAGCYLDINEDKKHNVTLFALYKPSTSNIIDLKKSFSNSTIKQLVEPPKEENVVFCRDIFELDIPTLRLRYVDLKKVPVEKSIKAIAKCRPNLVYDKHYTLTENEDGKRIRITWDPKAIENAGLLFKLKENDVLEVQYVSKE